VSKDEAIIIGTIGAVQVAIHRHRLLQDNHTSSFANSGKREGHTQSTMISASSSASATAFLSAALNPDGFVLIVTLRILPVNLLSPCL